MHLREDGCNGGGVGNIRVARAPRLPLMCLFREVVRLAQCLYAGLRCVDLRCLDKGI